MRLPLFGLAAIALATPALAQDPTEPTPDLKLSGNATVVSDYRFRGVSLSDEDFAIQGTLNLNHVSGFYVGGFASSLDDADNTSAFGEAEIDIYAGYTKEVSSGLTFDGGLLYYYYPDSLGGTDTDFFEPYVSLAQTFGPVTGKVGAAYAWEQDATADNDWLYLYGQVSTAIPNTPVTLTGRLGHQDFGSGNNYLEWAIGATATFGPVTAGLQYVDTDLGDFRNVDAGLVFSLGFAF